MKKKPIKKEIDLKDVLHAVEHGFKEQYKYTNAKFSDQQKYTDSKIEDLAIMVQSGFRETNNRFDKMDKKFDEIDKRLTKIENIILARHERELELLRERVLGLEKAIA